jgi:microsomal epoxide hydrolase
VAEAGYQAIQGSRPRTLAYGLTDSPAGLAAWIVEKFRAWSDCDGDVGSVFTLDELLTNVSLYWVTGCIGSSVRIYYEANRDPWRLGAGERVEVPTAFAAFPAENSRPPREWVERAYQVQRWSQFAKGGHFAALEQPEALVEDLRAFFRRYVPPIEKLLAVTAPHRDRCHLVTHFRVTGAGVEWEPPPGPGHHQSCPRS